MKIEFYPEICCDYCNEVIHNHMDCPACDKKYAPTSAYGEIDQDFYKTISCESCLAQFKLIKRDEDYWNTWECERVNEN